MAKELTARTALSVVVLERGPRRRTSDYAASMDELDYAIRLRMMQNVADETHTHRHSLRDTAVPVRQHGSFLSGSGVGGAGEHWNGMAYRFSPDQFILRTVLERDRGRANLSFEFSVQDWGVTYEELEAHYAHAERLLGVSGKAGNLHGRKIPGGNIFEGPRSSEYPTPPLKTSFLSTQFIKATQDLGYHPYPIPAANLSTSYINPDGINRPGCAYCGFCERFGCMIGAKTQPTNILIPILTRRSAFSLRADAWARRITYERGRATGVEYTTSSGEQYLQPAEVIILASWTLNNVRLLYLSNIGQAYRPEAADGTPGRNLTHQPFGNTNLFFEKPLNAFMGTGALGAAIGNFDGDRVPESSKDLIRGGAIWAPSFGNRPISSFGVIPASAAQRNWGSEWKRESLSWSDRVGRVAFAGEHLAYRTNFMDLDPIYTDKHGDPLLRLTLNWNKHEAAQLEWGNHLGQQIGRAMGARMVDSRPVSDRYDATLYQTTHIQGGAIMGESPASSVVNSYLQHWDMHNLWVIGASAFPQNASGNPTLAVLATTFRAADALITRYLKNPGALA